MTWRAATARVVTMVVVTACARAPRLIVSAPLSPGMVDHEAVVMYVQEPRGLVALDLRDGDILWRRGDVGEPIASGGGRLLAYARSPDSRVGFRLVDLRGNVLLRSELMPGRLEGEVWFAVRRATLDNVDLEYGSQPVYPVYAVGGETPGPGDATFVESPQRTDPPVRPGARPARPPAPELPTSAAWPPVGRVNLDLRTGRVTLLEGAPLYGRGAVPWAASTAPGHVGPPTVPAALAGPAVLAGATRLSDRSAVVLRKEGALIVLYRWHDGGEPGARTVLYHVRRGRDIRQVAVSMDGIVLGDCGDAACVYVLFSIEGKKLTISTNSILSAVGDIALASQFGFGGALRIERLDESGSVVWSRKLVSVLPFVAAPPAAH